MLDLLKKCGISDSNLGAALVEVIGLQQKMQG